jgi:hypothetical protein
LNAVVASRFVAAVLVRAEASVHEQIRQRLTPGELRRGRDGDRREVREARLPPAHRPRFVRDGAFDLIRPRGRIRTSIRGVRMTFKQRVLSVLTKPQRDRREQDGLSVHLLTLDPHVAHVG